MKPASLGPLRGAGSRPAASRGGRSRWACRLTTAIALVLPSAAFAEEPFRMAPALAGQLSRVECRIVGGRIKVTSQKIGGQVSTAFRRGNGQVQESLAIDFGSAWPKIDYQASTAELEIRIAVALGEQIAIRREPASGMSGARIALNQQPEGSVELSWQQGDAAVRIAGPTIWHVWLAEPQRCTEELAPLLRLIRPDWDFAAHGAAVERALFDAAGQSWTEHWPRWAELVQQLGDDRFSRRRIADRQLRRAGLAAVPYLQNLDDAQLDTEQRSRIRRIIDHLQRFEDEDTPQRAAIWLVGDSRVWLALLTRDEESVRQTAAEKLAEVLGRSIDFDPAGDAATRAGQLARLRAEIEVARPAVTPPVDEAR